MEDAVEGGGRRWGAVHVCEGRRWEVMEDAVEGGGRRWGWGAVGVGRARWGRWEVRGGGADGRSRSGRRCEAVGSYLPGILRTQFYSHT